ncbi:hypothetical protein CH063_09076 [Colletotrichum higginsianum]|uniref:Uncharacterized protein n=1 Tax=Colletotrichum higginsianum (strain IMI 349063) TaxID=759273 RepID=H1VC86_COLHI|nr:hypothetical protein CH063_09076 [Colletotrichum higginsianum]
MHTCPAHLDPAAAEFAQTNTLAVFQCSARRDSQPAARHWGMEAIFYFGPSGPELSGSV